MAISKLQNRSSCLDGKGVVPGVCLLLAIAVFLVFGQTLRHGFINYDDDEYVYNNSQVIKGLTLPSIGWAFTHSHSHNWHPLTWLSHMLDCQFYGLNAGGHHLTNVLLHAVTAILLFLVLLRMTGLFTDKSVGTKATQAGALWPSAFVASVFAIHPLRVESVAWIAERKDVLSGLFFMLTLGAYVRYVEKSKIQSPKSRIWYGLTLLFFALGLMSKPMLVTLPFVLLLLDYWPLGRFQPAAPRSVLHALRPLLWEKLPFLLLAAGSSIVTFLVQERTTALLEHLPLPMRLLNAIVSYAAYMGRMAWPENLAVFYPYHPKVPIWPVAGAGALLLFGTVLAVIFVRRFPYLLVGWLWYLGMLMPVIGIVQVGFQSHADRYTYLPQIGLYLVIAWTTKDLTASWRYRRQVLGVTALTVIAALMVAAWKQTSYWRDSESLWTHTLACTSDNAIAHLNLGLAFGTEGRLDEAIEHFQRAAEISPNQPQAYNNLGIVLFWQGRLDDAIANFARAIQIQPDYAEACLNWGAVLASQGNTPEAIALFQRALELKPNYADAHYNLGRAFALQGKMAEAIGHYQQAIQLQPDSPQTFYNLGMALATEGKLDEAAGQYRKAIQLKPDYADAHGNLANVLAAQGRLAEAVKEYQRTLELVPNSAQAHLRFGQALQTLHNFAAAKAEYQKVLELDPKHLPARLSLAWLLATSPEASLRDGNKAVALAQEAEQLSGAESPQILDTLAAAYAGAGRFPEAIETAKRALNLPAMQNNQPLTDAIQTRLELYETSSPYHERP